MKKLVILLIIIFCTFLTARSQTWEDAYKVFAQDFQEQNFDKAIISGNKTLELIGKKDTNYVSVLRYIAFAYYNLKDYNKAVETYEETQELSRTLYGTNNYNYILVTYNLAVNYTYIGKYSLAYPLMEEVIGFIVKDQGKNSMDYINTANQQANIYNLAGSYEKAEEIYQDVFETVKSNYKETDSMYMATVNVIAPFYFSHGMFDKAEPFYIHAVELMEKTYGKQSVNYITTLNSLGEFYIKAGMYEKSEKVYLEFVNICEKVYGKNSADYGTALNNLAVTYEKQEKNKQAEDVYLQCLKVKEKVYKKESSYYALTLLNLAVLYDNMGRYKEAEELLQQALDIYKKIYGEKDPNYAIALSNMSSIYSSNGKYSEAIEISLKAMEIQKNLYGEKYDGYINSLNTLALLYEQTGDDSSAEKQFIKAIELRKALQGENHTDYAVSLYNLANLKTNKGDYPEAEKLLTQALKIHKATVGEFNSSYANTLNSLAGLYSSMGNFLLAGETYERCRLIYEKIYGDMHPEYATFLSNVGLFYFESGDYDKAESVLKRSLNIEYNAFGKEHPDNLYILSGLANTMLAKGNNQMAEGYLVEATRITREKLGVDHPNYVSALLSLGVFYYQTGNYDKCEKNYLEVLTKYKKIYGEKNTNYATVLNDLGTLYLSKAAIVESQSDANQCAIKAADYFMEALKVDSIAVGLTHPDYAMHLNNLAELYRSTGQNEKAEPLYLKSIEIEKKVFGENYPGLAMTYHNLALLYNDGAKSGKAEEYCLKSLQLKQKVFGENNPVCSDIIFSLAYIYECANRFKDAETQYSRALQLNYQLIKNNFAFLSESDKSHYLKTISGNNEQLIAFAMKSRNSIPSVTGLVFNNELINKGLLLRSSGTMKNTILNGDNQELIDKYNQWIGIKQQLAKLNSLPAKSRYEDVAAIEEQANMLEKELVSKSTDFKNEDDLFNKDWTEIRKSLKENEAAIEFARINYRYLKPDSIQNDNYAYVALIIRPGYKQPEMVELTEEQQLQRLVNKKDATTSDFIAGLYSRGIQPLSTNVQIAGDSLYSMIWKPMLHFLRGVKTVYYSPEGMLHQIAFAAIPNTKDSLLSDVYDIRCVSSTAVLNNTRANSGKPNSLCLFGGITYDADTTQIKKLAVQYQQKNKDELAMSRSFDADDTRGSSWNYLPGTLTEVQNIQTLSEKQKIITTIYSGENATEESLKSLAGKSSPDVIHIATHGFFFPNVEKKDKQTVGESVYRMNENPLFRSGLLLAGANYSWKGKPITGIEDGILTAYEAGNLNLENTKLVVLSACETGLGDIKGSEGVYGLQRAFKMAGVKYIIMSLWQVPDKETVEFMKLFYTNWFSNGDIRKAFTETQRTMRKKYAPYFWAAFVLVE